MDQVLIHTAGPLGAGTGCLPAALDLDEFRDDMSTSMDISSDGFTLCIHAEAGDALLVGTDPEVGIKINSQVSIFVKL